MMKYILIKLKHGDWVQLWKCSSSTFNDLIRLKFGSDHVMINHNNLIYIKVK